MNTREKEILLTILESGYKNQRDIAAKWNCSLGAVNGAIKTLISEGFLTEEIKITQKTKELIRKSAPERAVILAAGAGLRMPPDNEIQPKALIEVNSEALIDRLIRQLSEVGITEIYVVVGFQKEKFEYLIDKFNVELVINSEYEKKNNLHSLSLVKDKLNNCYITPSDIWCDKNPFSTTEVNSWYLVTTDMQKRSSVRINRKRELSFVSSDEAGNEMIGISYILREDAVGIKEKLQIMDMNRRYDGSFWEETLYSNDKMVVCPKVVNAGEVVEINTFEDLQKADEYRLLPLNEVACQLNVNKGDITEINLIKKGITNSSYSFVCQGKKYVMRIRTDKVNEIINHQHEADVYKALSGLDISDEMIYINPQTGLKISEYISETRLSNPKNKDDVDRCMKKLRQFHKMQLSVGYEFDLFERIEYLESLWGGKPSVYKDYEQTKKNIFSLKKFIDSQEKIKCLTHIDAVEDNFLISTNNEDYQNIRIIDWEYSAMQDPHLDIAMYGLYSLYKREEFDYLISRYFENGCSEDVKLKIYCYIAIAGLLWSNWCEYKLKKGMEFGEYSLRQYRYAKEYYRTVKQELDKREDENV